MAGRYDAKNHGIMRQRKGRADVLGAMATNQCGCRPTTTSRRPTTAGSAAAPPPPVAAPPPSDAVARPPSLNFFEVLQILPEVGVAGISWFYFARLAGIIMAVGGFVEKSVAATLLAEFGYIDLFQPHHANVAFVSPESCRRCCNNLSLPDL
uniref:Uncharacterized protein n=1 Tax=Tanacetum cinerariifolium TaxID=118510 RepID=A0A6L2MHV1_TANCI|nr:hypothetical protein [Tanacetum cinerariifolium]